jgi:hypothetical protein
VFSEFFISICYVLLSSLILIIIFYSCFLPKCHTFLFLTLLYLKYSVSYHCLIAFQLPLPATYLYTSLTYLKSKSV